MSNNTQGIEVYSWIIEKEASNLSQDDAIELLTRIARIKSCRDHISEWGSGTNIRLDKIPDSVIKMIYQFMKDRLGLDDFKL